MTWGMYFACQSANQPEKLYLHPKSGLFMDEIWFSSSLFSRFISFVVCFGLCKLSSLVTRTNSFSTGMAAQLGRLVVNELEAALENKYVVCYIKYFDKLVRGAVTRKYPLVKIYRYEDVFPIALQVSTDSIREATGTSMLSEKDTVDLTKDDEDGVHFFTPSTKNLIAEISASTQATVTDSASPAGCKRVLSFTDVPRATAIVKIEPIEDAALMKPMTESSSSVESPVKKSKGKLKQN